MPGLLRALEQRLEDGLEGDGDAGDDPAEEFGRLETLADILAQRLEGKSSAALFEIASSSVPLLPGAVTASEVMAAREAGFNILKFFPASTSGGAAAIKAFAGPFGDIRFVPTGGINLDNAIDYLSLNNVRAVGGSWLTPADAINDERWDVITELAVNASQLGQ